EVSGHFSISLVMSYRKLGRLIDRGQLTKTGKVYQIKQSKAALDVTQPNTFSPSPEPKATVEVPSIDLPQKLPDLQKVQESSLTQAKHLLTQADYLNLGTILGWKIIGLIERIILLKTVINFIKQQYLSSKGRLQRYWPLVGMILIVGFVLYNLVGCSLWLLPQRASESKQLQEELQKITTELGSLRRELDRSQIDLASSKRELELSQNSLNMTREQLSNVQDLLKERQSKLLNTEHELYTTKNQLQNNHAELADQQRKNNDLTVNLNQERNLSQKMQQKVEILEEQIRQSKEELARKQLEFGFRVNDIINNHITMDQIVNWTKQGMDTSELIGRIKESHSTYGLVTADVEYLRQYNVDDEVIKVMQESS
ncbi:MAG: hypothetical protein WCH62_04890, partial [Candidatus Omnitrophota bacterium]